MRGHPLSLFPRPGAVLKGNRGSQSDCPRENFAAEDGRTRLVLQLMTIAGVGSAIWRGNGPIV